MFNTSNIIAFEDLNYRAINIVTSDSIVDFQNSMEDIQQTKPLQDLHGSSGI
jgi:hypothetical protein